MYHNDILVLSKYLFSELCGDLNSNRGSQRMLLSLLFSEFFCSLLHLLVHYFTCGRVLLFYLIGDSRLRHVEHFRECSCLDMFSMQMMHWRELLGAGLGYH